MKRQLLTLTTCVLLVGCQQSGSNIDEGGAWRYSEHLDKLTGNQTFTAEARLTDKEVPLVMTDVVLKCDPKQPGNSISPKGAISIEFTALKSIPKGSVLDEMREFDGIPLTGELHNNVGVVTLAVRADSDSPLTALGFIEQYNNRVSLTLKDGGEKIDSMAALLSLSGSVLISPSTQKEIVVRIPTEQGSPTLSIPLQHGSVKKVASQCGWNLGQQVATATSAASNSQHSSASAPEAHAATASPTVEPEKVSVNSIGIQSDSEFSPHTQINGPKGSSSSTSTRAQERADNSIQVVTSAVQTSVAPMHRVESNTTNTEVQEHASNATADQSSPSFDCEKAKSKIERQICASPKLASLDVNLSETYKGIQKYVDKKQLKSEQIAWIKERNACADDMCLEYSYKERLDGLKDRLDRQERAATQKYPQ